MVFSGRPSSACHACRVKRLKVRWRTATVTFASNACQCDQIRPGCTQCSRKEVACPGYRSAFELRLRDDTDRVVRKAQSLERATADLLHSTQLYVLDSDLASVSETRLVASSSILNSGADYSAVCFFMSSYIVPGPFQEYLPSMYARCRLGDDTLSAAINAASFATYARQSGHRGYMHRGRRSYTSALALINTALANPASAVLDQTLASILLLGIFESIVFPGARSPEEWNAHLLGAAKLLQLRGPQQFESEFGAQLFSHTANNIRASSMQRFVSLPAEFKLLNDEATPFLDPKDPGNRIGPIVDKAIRIKALISNYSRDRGVLYDVFDEAAVLEREAAVLIKDDDPELGYIVQSIEQTPSWAYHDISYHYKTHRASKICNTLRMVRLFLLEVMSAGASLAIERLQNRTGTRNDGQDARDTSYFTAYKQDVRRLSAEIAAEVLGCIPDFVEPSSTGPRFCPSSRTLVWPLSVIYKNRVCPPQAREYARSMADKLVKDLDKLKLVDSSKLITEPECVEDW